jgi:16S rRNA (guanine966-N2)-methyltransferase
MRVTGGKHRSRGLKAPRGSETRPTSDRVREALFGILEARRGVSNARVLDLYAGTGALAIEALSRGAAHATMVERDRNALAALRANVQALELRDSVRIVATPVERAARSLEPGSFDVVFVDPPYADVTTGTAIRALEDVIRAGVLAEGATVVLEHAPARGKEEEGPPVEGLVRTDTRTYGDTCLSFYEKV